MDTLKIAAAYIRVSTEDQTEYSPDAQLRELREFALTHNMLLDDRFIYADEGISGRKADKRPAFMEMIRTAKLKEHPFDVILVHKFDRFARSREDSVVYKSMLKRCGVEVVSIKEPIAEGNFSGVMEAIYESFAEAYSINLGQEVKKGMTEKALRGEPQTAPPYGYLLSPKPSPVQSLPPGGKVSPVRKPVTDEGRTFVPHPVEAPYVRELFLRFAQGEGLFPLAKWMNDNGQRTHRGGKFENRTVEYILRNPVYIGKVRWNPNGRSRRNFDAPGMIVADGSHEALIEPELWEAVQQRMADVKARWHYHGRPTYEKKHWLSGIVRCAACGSTLIFAAPCYFKCGAYVRGRCKSTQHIKADVLADALIEQLRTHVTAESLPQTRIIRTKNQAEIRLQQLRRQLASAEKKKTRLLEAYLNGADILAEFNDMKKALNDEADRIRAEISAVEAEATPIDAAALLRQRIAETLRILEAPDVSMQEKYEAADRLIDRCTFDKATMTLSVTYRISI